MPSSRVTIEDIPESPIRTLAPLPWDAEALIDTDNPLIPTALTAGSIGSPHHVGEPDSMLDSSTSDMAVDVPSFLRSAFHEEEEEAEPSLPIHFSNSDVAMDTDDVSPLLGIFHEEEEEEQSHPTPSSTTLAVRHALFPTEAEEEEEEEVEVGPRRHPVITVTHLSEVDVLPVTLSNNINLDAEDGISYVINPINMRALFLADIGLKTLIVAETPPSCDYIIVDPQVTRQGPFPRHTVSSVREAEEARVLRRDRLQQDKLAISTLANETETPDDLGKLRVAAARQAAAYARQNFPYNTPPGAFRDFARTWQHEMQPEKRVLKPCAVCGRRTVQAKLTEENPVDYDLSLLRNQFLPEKTLPTTYAIDLYQGAILCPAALRSLRILGPMDMCPTCKSALKAGRQPVDSLANFHYYAQDELPAAVRQAFKDSSMFDILMVARW
ncbi:hypothetical protein B0H11DRAFT_2289662 [Mycena galericulata]|nr:hypothetical protein B0H11DRAFT_2289662 [Mycena galericulata]